ncbi:hypothetical protein B0H10DRAFT_2285786 [Mycena sp. CBHHK59/15]|nr:hypothetical protein B0H10DRAFT_2285786 [Mycena sp. CBHHK59/15]
MVRNSSRMGLVPPETFYDTPRRPSPRQSTSESANTIGVITWVPEDNSPMPGPNHTSAGRASFPRTNNLSASTPAATNVPSTQPRLRAKRRNLWEKADEILLTIGKEFNSFAHFLEVMFYNQISGVPDLRTTCHVRAVAAFLGGETNVTMATIINLLYNHPQSRPSRDSPDFSLHFSPPDISSPRDINCARPALSTWALQIVGPELRRQTWGLTQNDPTDPTDTTQLRAGTNGRAKNIRLATWDAFGRVQVGAISCLTLSRNWTHVDEKRVFSRFGFTVHDTMARACLDSLTDSSMSELRVSVAEGIANGTMYWQSYRPLVYFIPELTYLRAELTALLNSPGMTKRRLPKDRITKMQPVGTNAEHSTETQGMMRALLDFFAQLGLDEKALENLIFMPCGYGASIAAIWRIKKFLCPEIFHTRWTKLNAISANSYAPASSADPSGLSKSATAAGAKRPSNLKKVDFFPTSCSMKLFYEARVLDCWRISFGAEDIIEHFAKPTQNPPDLHSLLAIAWKLVKRYTSQQAYDQALDKDWADSASGDMKIPPGTAWVPPAENSRGRGGETGEEGDEDDPEVLVVDEANEEAEIHSESDDGAPKKKKKRPSVHVEADDFTGDRVMANKILFLRDMGWWVIASDAVPDGEIGRVWEVMKIWIISFAGSGNHNYTNYLLETYCLHRYEASKDFSDAMFNNWLISLRGKGYIECDWVQEDFNKWLETLVEHKGGDFDDHFYRHTLAPNVMHFLRMKEKMETAFELKPRGKTHEDQLHLFRPGRTMEHAAVNFYAWGYEKLEDTHIAKFIHDSTAYSDVMKDVLDGKEYDDWDEDMQLEFDALLKSAEDGDEEGDSGAESETESMAGDGASDPGVRGLNYSDNESDEEGHLTFSPEEPANSEDENKDDEILSKLEEDGMDDYVPIFEEPAAEE